MLIYTHALEEAEWDNTVGLHWQMATELHLTEKQLWLEVRETIYSLSQNSELRLHFWKWPRSEGQKCFVLS